MSSMMYTQVGNQGEDEVSVSDRDKKELEVRAEEKLIEYWEIMKI